VRLIETLTNWDPKLRGTMQEADQAPFFTEYFRHMDEDFQPVPMQDLLEDAKR